MNRRTLRVLALAGWAAYLLLPVYSLVAMALRTNESILSERSVLPTQPTLANFAEIFADPSWYQAFGHSLAYVAINTVVSILVALPAAYAFSRYRFTGDSHLFFWLLT